MRKLQTMGLKQKGYEKILIKMERINIMRRTRCSMLSLFLLVSFIFIFTFPESAAVAATGTPKVVFLGKPIDGMLYLGDDNTVLAIPNNGKPYYLDMDGKVLLSAKQLDKIVKKAGGKVKDGYSIRNFNEGYAVIECTPVKAGEDDIMSIFIDKKGKIAFTAPGSGRYVQNGVAIVNSSSTSNMFSRAYDTQGNLLASIKGNNGTFTSYSHGIYVRNFDGISKYVDSNNKPLIKGYYLQYAAAFDDDLIAPAVDSDYKYGFLNSNGDVVLDFKYGGVGGCDSITNKYFNDGLLAVVDWDTGLWGYIDITGKVILPFQYENADSFTNGLALVRGQNPNGLRSGNLGYIDTTGKEVIPLKYDFMTPMINGYCLGEKDNVCTIYDATGKAYKTPKMNLGYIDIRKNVSVFIYDAPGDKKGMATIQVEE